MAQAPQPPRHTEQLHCYYGNHLFDFTYCGNVTCRSVSLKRAGCWVTLRGNVSCPDCSADYSLELWGEVDRLMRNHYHCHLCAAVGVPQHPPWWSRDGGPQPAVAEADVAMDPPPPPPPQRAPPRPAAPPGLHEQRIRRLEETVEALSQEVTRLAAEVVALRAEQARREEEDAAVAAAVAVPIEDE